MSDDAAAPCPRPDAPDSVATPVREHRALAAAAFVAWVFALVAVNVVPYVPTHDGPQHIYLGHVINHFSDPGSVYPSYFRPTQPLSAMGFSLLFCPLDDLLGWELGFRVSLSVLVTLWGWSTWSLARALAPRRAAVAVVGFALAFQWAFYMGFFSWLLSMAVGFFTLALAVRVWPWTPARRSLITALLFVAALMHAFPAQVTALVLGTVVVLRTRPRAWPKQLGLLALMGVPVVLVASYAAGWLGAESIDLPSGGPLRAAPAFSDRFALPFRALAGGPLWRSAPVVLAVIVGAVTGLRGWIRGTSERADRALWLAAAVLAAVFLIAPLHLAQWELFSPRFMPPAAVLFLVVLPIERLSSRLRGVTLAAASTYTIAALAWTTWFHIDLSERTSDVRAAMAAPIRRSGPRLPVALEVQAGYGARLATWYAYFEPTFNLGPLFAIEQGGVVPYTFTSVPQLHGLVFTEEGLARMPPAPHRQVLTSRLHAEQRAGDVAGARSTLTLLASFGVTFEDVILYAPGEEYEVFLERGYRVDAHRGRARLMRFQGCPVRVSVEIASPLTHALTFEYGWHPVTTSSWAARAPTGTPPQEGVVAAVLDKTPCGPVWLRVWSDENDSGQWDAGDHACLGAATDARFVVELKHGVDEVRCKLDGE